ncbi:hypothetical protein PRNP1_011925 [Phytophthora ramorum]
MWLSSFASSAADDGSSRQLHTVHGHVWSARGGSSLGSADDALTLVVTSDLSLLRRLRVVHDSFVTLQFQERSHVARLCLLPQAIVNSSDQEQVAAADANAKLDEVGMGDVTLSPLLAFNLGIQLHSVTGSHVAVSLFIRAALPQELGLAVQPSMPFRRKRQEQPASASYAMIAPLLVSSLSCRQHALMQQRDGLLDAIRAYFATPKVLQAGDVFAVELRETTQSHVPKENERYKANYVPYKCVEVPAACMLPEDGVPTEAVTELMPPTLDLDTSLLFIRVEKIDGDNKNALALTVSDATELMQGSSTSAPSPDEATIKHFMAQSRYRGAAAPFDSPLVIDHPAETKTLVHQVAKQLGVVTVEVPFTELTGQSELHLLENVRNQVSKAQALSPCLLYISHLFPVEKDNEEAELRIGAVLSECIRSLSQNQHSIPLIACVEDVNEVPKFIRQCFLYEMHLEAPDQPKRLEFLQHMAASIELSEDVDLKEVAQLTAGRTYGELSAMLADAGSLAIERILGDETDTSEQSLEDLVFADSDDLPHQCSVSAKDMEEAAQSQQAQASSANIGNASIPNVKWTDVGGLEDVKDEILDVVQLPIKHPELFASGLKVLKAQTRKFALAEDADLEAIVEHCPTNFTGADFYALSSSALAAALKDRVEALDQQLEEINAEDCYSSSPMTIRLLLNRLSPEELRVPVSQEHFMSALSQVVPSVSPAEIQHYENLKKQYSSRQT